MKLTSHLLVVSLCLSLAACNKASEPADPKVSRIKELLSHTDKLLKIQRLPEEYFDLPPAGKDTVDGTVTSHWVPGKITILPVTVEEVNKPESRIRGANITLEDDYYVISSKYSSPSEGKHSKSTSALDIDELSDLQTAITYMQGTARDWRTKNPPDDTTVRFHSKDGFSLEVEQDSTKKVVFEMSIDDTSSSLGDEQLAALLGKISHAVDELKKR